MTQTPRRLISSLPHRCALRAGAALLSLQLHVPGAGAQCSPAWSSLGTNVGGVVNGVAPVWTIQGSPGYLVAAGGTTTPGQVLFTKIALWDGWSWSYLGSGLGDLGAIAEDVASPPPWQSPTPGPVVFAGGAFSSAGGKPASDIAMWSSGAWAQVGGGIDPGTVYELYWCDASPPLGPALYVGGQFSAAGGLPIKGLARWDGKNWSALGNGLEPWSPTSTPSALAFAMYDDDGPGPRTAALYVGGNFRYAGGVEVRNLGRWNGTMWEGLGFGTGSGSAADALCVFDPDGLGPIRESLFVGGASFDVAGLQTNGLARWDGANWHAIPGWIGNSLLAMATFDDDGPGPNRPALFVGGFHTAATGVPLNCIAKWDGQQWFTVGGGLTQAASGTPRVRAFGVFDEDGDGPNPGGLYVGGFFTVVGGSIEANAIARWGCPLPPRCDANCNRDFHTVTGLPILSVADFGCFQTRFVLQDPYGDCNEDAELTVADFGCFQTKFVTGCP